jgi:serine/threonine-protein kinase
MTSSTTRKAARLVAETLEPSEAAQASKPPEPNPYLAGEVIADRYRLQRELGRGGMGVVWVAHSLVLGVDVALKLIRASVAGSAVASRMAREAHAAARLGHPALVRVFDFGWTNRGDPFLVMELVLGETLAALLARESRIPAIRAVQMLLPIADGLRLAHDRTIIHRDIKPENIFLASDTLGRAQPKLLDFGIAKVGPNTLEGKLTQFGAILGSPEYMSPEQALGVDDVDDRTDVWSLCIVLYEMVTGTIPFRKPNYNALMHAIINEQPKPISAYHTGDEALWLVLTRGLAKEREQRWANMTELGEALALWLYEHGVKEDLSGNSVRAVWLDGALSGVRVDVPQSNPPAGDEPARPSPQPSLAEPVRRATFDTQQALIELGRFPGRGGLSLAGRRPLAVALGAGALIGAALAVAFGITYSQREPEPSAAASAPGNAPAASATAVPNLAPALTEVSAASAPTASASAPTRASATRSSPRSLAPTQRKPVTSKRNHDFGF